MRARSSAVVMRRYIELPRYRYYRGLNELSFFFGCALVCSLPINDRMNSVRSLRVAVLIKNRFFALLHLNWTVDIIDMVLYVDRLMFVILRFFFCSEFQLHFKLTRSIFSFIYLVISNWMCIIIN